MTQRTNLLVPLTEAEEAMLPAETSLGAAMKKLEARERLFVVCLLNQGSRQNFYKAAKVAGFVGSPEAVRQRGKRLAHEERVQDAIIEEARKRLKMNALASVGFLSEVLGDRKVDVKARLKAAEMVMDRTGLPAVTKQEVSVTREMSREEKLKLILEYARATGQDPKVLLGSAADVVEGDYRVLGIEIAAPDADLALAGGVPATAAATTEDADAA